MSQSVSLVEINVYDDMIPLVSGYLEAYATATPKLQDNYRFTKYTATTSVPFKKLIQDLGDQDSDIYAFSCYLWNSALVKRILPELERIKPEAHVLLGGPQVMHHAHEYLRADNERMHVCNGEGEKTFASYLEALLDPQADFFKVPGLSFFFRGELQTTPQPERILNLDEIPSPFLNGLFDDHYQTTVFETNRGCPFRCGFCFWGAATNDRVAKFSEERIRAEIEWASRRQIPYIILADANWGMLRRDIELSRFMTACKEKHGNPIYVYFSAAKNSPGKVARITELFKRKGMFNVQPISMQSLDDATLDSIDRSNIKLSAYEELQSDLNEKGISSFIELIWPLPGETLDSFRQGVTALIAGKARTIVVYPHLLLHNTPLYERQTEFGLVTRRVNDGVSEAEIVIETNSTSRREFVEGMWFIYAILAIHNTDTLTELRGHLHVNDICLQHEFLGAFADFCREHGDTSFARFCESSIAKADYYDVLNYPSVYYQTLHSKRGEFDELLYSFVSSQPWWRDPDVSLLFEVGMLTRPYIYGNTPINKPSWPLRHISTLQTSGRTFTLRLSDDQKEILGRHFDGDWVANNGANICLDHRRGQFPHVDRQSAQRRADYCNGVSVRIRDYRPAWSSATVR